MKYRGEGVMNSLFEDINRASVEYPYIGIVSLIKYHSPENSVGHIPVSRLKVLEK